MTTPTVGQLGWRAPINVQLSPPIMIAHAAIPAPALITAITLQLSTPMRATATVLAPTIGLTFTVPVPTMIATAAMRTPTVSIGKQVTAALMGAVASMLTPTISAAVNVTSIPMAAAAAMLAPTVSITVPGPAFDAVGAGTYSVAITASLSWSATATAGSTIIVPAVLTTSGGAVTALTYGGVAMSLVGSVPLNNVATNGLLYLFKLAGAPGGAQTVTASLNPSSKGAGNSISYTNVTTVGTASTVFGTGAALSQALTCSTNQLIAQAFASITTINAGAAGGTQRYRGPVAGINIQDSASSTTFTAATSSSQPWGGIGVVLS